MKKNLNGWIKGKSGKKLFKKTGTKLRKHILTEGKQFTRIGKFKLNEISNIFLLEKKKIYCPNCSNRVNVTGQSVMCKYCQTTINTQAEIKFNSLLRSKEINNIDEIIEEALIPIHRQVVKWQDFLNKVVSNELFESINEEHRKQKIVDTYKDRLYERLPVESVKSVVTIEESIQNYITKPQFNEFDLIALAGIIRNGIEKVLKIKEDKLNIRYGEKYISFGNRVREIFGDARKAEVMVHWRNCSAIIHSDDSSEIYHLDIKTKRILLQQAYQFYLSFQGY